MLLSIAAFGAGLVVMVIAGFFLSRKKKPDDHDAHAEGLVRAGQSWAVPTTIVFSVNALMSMAGPSFVTIISQISHHQLPDMTRIVSIATSTVIVVGFDLVLLNAAINIRNLRARHKAVPWSLQATVWGISIIESATFAYITWKLENPPDPHKDLTGFAIAAFFIIARAVAAPMVAIYLGTMTKLPKTLGDIALTVMTAAGNALANNIAVDATRFGLDELVAIIAVSADVADLGTPQAQARRFLELARFVNAEAQDRQHMLDGLMGAGNRSGEPENNAARLLGNPGGERGKPILTEREAMGEVAHFEAAGGAELLGSPHLRGTAGNPDEEPSAGIAEVHAVVSGSPRGTSDAGDPGGEEIESVGASPSGLPHIHRVLESQYTLPDGITFESRISQRQVEELFGISDSSLQRRWANGTNSSPSGMSLGINPVQGSNNAKMWVVSDLLAMYEAGVFNGLTHRFAEYEEMDIPALVASNGHHV